MANLTAKPTPASTITVEVDLSAAIAALKAEIARLNARLAPVQTGRPTAFPSRALWSQHQRIGLFLP